MDTHTAYVEEDTGLDGAIERHTTDSFGRRHFRGRVLTHVDTCWLHRDIERSYEAFLWSKYLGYQLTNGMFSP